MTTPSIFNYHLNKKQLRELDHAPTWKKYLVDIFDDNLASSPISFLANSVILLSIVLSSIEIIFRAHDNFTHLATFFSGVYVFTSILFTIELIARLSVIEFYHKKYAGWRGKLRYLTSFYGLIDVISILPFYIDLIGFTGYQFLKILRVMRIWRVVRYVPAIANLNNAFKSKGEDILISFLAVFLVSISISTFIYYAEERANNEQFDSVLTVLIWSIGKYTDDYGSIADYAPVTLVGKILATLNGLLGIAIFAVPAGLLGSAFIDELNEQKQKKVIKEKIKLIDKYFKQYFVPKKIANNQKVYPRYYTFDAITARTLLSEQEILECVRNAKHLVIRAMKSSDELKFNDIKIVERFYHNASYGTCLIHQTSNVYIINPMGATERGISHFTHALSDCLQFNYIARQLRMYKDKDELELIKPNYEDIYETYQKEDTDRRDLPHSFQDFMFDITHNISPENWVFVMCSGGSGRDADIIVEYGLAKGANPQEFENSTIHDVATYLQFENHLKTNLSNVNLIRKNKAEGNFQFKVALHKVGNKDEK